MSKRKQQPARVVGGDSGALATSELSQSLDQLQYEANSWAEQVEQYAHRAVEAAIECGRRLVAVKARLGHGKWAHWLGQSFDYDQRTAERYMSLAEYAGAIANQPTITRALAVIADIREEQRAAEGKPSRRKAEPVPEPEPELIVDEPEPEPEPERDEQPRPSVAKVTAASRKPEQPEPVRIPPPQLLPEDDADDDEPAEVAGGLTMKATLNMLLGPTDFYVEADRLYWIGFDGIEQESNPLQLLEYIQNLVSEEMPECRAAVVAALRLVADELERD